MPSSSKEKQKAYDEKRKASRARNWCLVAYPEDLPENWLDQLKGKVSGFCSPLHDADRDLVTDERGEQVWKDKKPHHHLVVTLPNKTTLPAITEMLTSMYGAAGDSIKGIATPEICHSVTGSVRYMAHADNPEKAQYDREQIQAWGGKSVDRVWGDDSTLVRGYLVEIEMICEARKFVELSDLSAYLREAERWELYDTLTRRCTMYISSYMASRRHKAEAMRKRAEQAAKRGDTEFDRLHNGKVIEDYRASEIVVDENTGEIIDSGPVGADGAAGQG